MFLVPMPVRMHEHRDTDTLVSPKGTGGTSDPVQSSGMNDIRMMLTIPSVPSGTGTTSWHGQAHSLCSWGRQVDEGSASLWIPARTRVTG